MLFIFQRVGSEIKLVPKVLIAKHIKIYCRLGTDLPTSSRLWSYSFQEMFSCRKYLISQYLYRYIKDAKDITKDYLY